MTLTKHKFDDGNPHLCCLGIVVLKAIELVKVEDDSLHQVEEAGAATSLISKECLVQSGSEWTRKLLSFCMY